MSIETSLLVAIAMLIGNAFFVGAEFALVSARRSNIELKALDGSLAAKATLVAMEQVSLMLAGAQLGVTLCSLIFGAVGEPLVSHALHSPFNALGVSQFWLEPVSFAIALILMVYLHVVIGEMVPKNLSLASPTRAALLLVPVLLYLVQATKPVIVALNAVANSCLRLVGVKPSHEIASSFSRDEVAGFVKESHREGLLSEEEEHLLSGTLDFDERSVKSVIVPFESIVTTSAKPTPQEIEALTTKTGFSRFPIPGKKGSLNGYVHIKDILQIADNQYDVPLHARSVRQLASIKSTMSLRDALATMQASGAHLGQVSNSRGKVMGIIMLEDLLEELVGSIRDETQKQQR
jgi:CBS domain containing-hemolysin-like protein